MQISKKFAYFVYCCLHVATLNTLNYVSNNDGWHVLTQFCKTETLQGMGSHDIFDRSQILTLLDFKGWKLCHKKFIAVSDSTHLVQIQRNQICTQTHMEGNSRNYQSYTYLFFVHTITDTNIIHEAIYIYEGIRVPGEISEILCSPSSFWVVRD